MGYIWPAMRRLLFLFLFSLSISAVAVSQSGRRISPTTAAPTAPVQPSLNPEPEATTARPNPAALSFLPEKLLEHHIRTLDNTSFRFADFQGKVIVINIWASWCGPCRMEVPDYEKVRREYSNRDVEFIGLTPEDPGAGTQRITKFVRETGFGFLLGWADRETAQILMNGNHSIPQTLVIDRSGSIVNHWSGYSRRQSGDRLREAIENALK